MTQPTPQGLAIRDANGLVQFRAVTPALDATGATVVISSMTVAKEIVSDPDVLASLVTLNANVATAAKQPALNGDGGGLAHITNWPGALAYSLCASVSIGTSSTLLVNASSLTSSLIVTNPSAIDVWINLVADGAAVVGQGIVVPAGAHLAFGASNLPLPTGQINAICATGPVTLALAGG